MNTKDVRALFWRIFNVVKEKLYLIRVEMKSQGRIIFEEEIFVRY
jgi:hypothetical protein